MAFNTLLLERAMNPETVQACFLDSNDGELFARSLTGPLCEPQNSINSPEMSPPGTECFDIFPPPPGEREVTSQVERLSSNETKIAPRSIRMAV